MSSADVCIRSAAPGDAAGLAALARRVFVSPAGCPFYQAYAGGRQRDGDALDSSACFLAATTAVLNGAQLKRDYTLPIAAIFEEDRAVVESQRPNLLPLDLQAELLALGSCGDRLPALAASAWAALWHSLAALKMSVYLFGLTRSPAGRMLGGLQAHQKG